MSFLYSLGIDLGTSNSALALTDLATGETSLVAITQSLGPNRIGELPTLASALYLPHPQEFPAADFALPWTMPGGITGQFARDHGALVPDRLVTSAKSWLSNPHVDARQPVLPWGADEAVEKVSAFEASRRYLVHLKEAFLHAEAAAGRTRNLADAQVVLTVPASFDEVARSLTYEAAGAAGLENVILLEEPQAAFYAWTAQVGSDWRAQVNRGDIVLVCDVGGGTADFSLIAVTEKDGNLALERISVGEHLLLGGDNMDLALAYTLRAQLEEDGKSTDDWQFLALIHAARAAKVSLFSDTTLDHVPVTVPSRGSGLFAKNLSTQLNRATLEAVVLDGFLEMTSVTEMPLENAGTALQEFGLPYAADAVISKHLARFLTRSLQNVKASEALSALVGERNGTFLKPDAVLFNGGVFKATPLRQRVLDLLASWCDGEKVRSLEGDEPDLAVALGAADYGRNRATGQGIRIKAGTARSYYIGLESSGPAVPGFKPPVKALCIVPQGMEEGSDCRIEGRDFGLITGKPAGFRFFSSEIRSGDTPGQILPNAERELEETRRIEVHLPVAEGFPEGQMVPVRMEALVTETGNLELWMNHTASDQRWKVEFNVRTD
ncbi:MAG: Hsp70 family protein [Verrucomicrobiota bacterium]